ncbi:MAG TPA: amidohydrolase family protein [Burkholderiales bacterium]|jgi:predicted TIM-barrel fold metal-dependent hydrolase
MTQAASTPTPVPVVQGIIVDAHAHVFTADMPVVNNPRHRPDYDFTPEQYLEVMDKHGVRYACLAAGSPWADYNDYMIEALRKCPGRLRGTVNAEPDVERYTLEAMARDGVVGVRISFITMKEIPDLTTFAWRRFLRRLRDLDWHVHLHVDGRRLPQVLPHFEASGVKLVLDHYGRPDPAKGIACEGFQAMLKSIERGRTWVKVSAGYRLGEERVAAYGRELLRAVGPDRLLWASDCPFVGDEKATTYRRTMETVNAWMPDDATRRKVFGENALKLYFS